MQRLWQDLPQGVISDLIKSMPRRISACIAARVSLVIEEAVDLSRQTNFEVDGDEVQGLLNSHDQELTIGELIEMQEQDIEELESLDLIQSEDRMMIWNWTEDLSLTEKGLQILENIDSNEERIFSTEQGTKKLLACYEEILRKEKIFNPADYFKQQDEDHERYAAQRYPTHVQSVTYPANTQAKEEAVPAANQDRI
ncbi:tigger transposable element-derived protein 1 [Trichonephila clavipes]|nr:tigger transposable element-derived protein 1 [Trichonephila clavipes]